MREAVFSSLESQLGSLAGLRVLDLYAGTGALGLEAASRGAAHVLLVESDPAAARTARVNAATVGSPGVQVRQSTVSRVLARPPAVPYDLVFADPPYSIEAESLAGELGGLTGGWLAAGALVVVERPRRATPMIWPEGLIGERERRYGETMVWYGQPASRSR